MEVLTAGALAALVIELVKWVVRWAKKDYEFEFPVKFYLVMLPVTSFVLEPALAWLGVGEYAIPSDVEMWVKQLVTILLSSLVAAFTQSLAIKGLSDKAKERLS